MPLADLLDRQPAADFLRGPRCTVCATLDTLDPTEADALRTLLSDPAWRYVELSDALHEQGVDLPAQTLARHARGRCGKREKLR